jgi:aspartate kinase
MVVQKFGGTSVADPAAIRRLIEIVRAARARAGRGPVGVVSAMSGVTDELLALASAAGAGRRDDALARVGRLRARHLVAAQDLVPAAGQAEVTADIDAELDALAAVVQDLEPHGGMTPRVRDVVAATGELLSSRIVAAALAGAGLSGAWVDPRRVVVTSDEHTRALPLVPETYAALRTQVDPLLDAGAVPVTGGFVGATPAGETTTLGRGGSDYSAALVGAGLGVSEIQIWTDVDGLLSADPRIIACPRLVPQLSFAEAAELAYFGAKVLHPSTIRPAVEKNIPVHILNSSRPEGAGTLISAEGEADPTRLTGLASKRNVTVVDITSTRMLMAYGFLRQVFEVFERFKTAVDMVTTSEVSVSVTVDDATHLAGVVEALSEFAEVSVVPHQALLCAVGDVLQDEPELAARVIGVLEEVPLRMISQAASRRNITVVLGQEDLPHAMERLHEEFFT